MIKRIIAQTTLFITGAFSFVAALAWNDAIRTILKIIDRPPYGVFAYAITVTIIAVAVSVWLGKISYKYGSESDPRNTKKYRAAYKKTAARGLFSRFVKK